MLDFLKRFFKKLINFIKKYWWIVLIVVACFLPTFATFLKSVWSFIGPKIKALWSLAVKAGGAIAKFANENGWKTTIGIGLGALSVLSPDTAKRVVSNVADVAKTTVEATADVATSLLKNPVVLFGGGLLVFSLLRRKNA